jgi:uncharacterized Zn finger protein (UPF0148 family)
MPGLQQAPGANHQPHLRLLRPEGHSMTMPTCRICKKRWFGKPTSTICGPCVAEKKKIDTDNMTVRVLQDNREAILERPAHVGSKTQRQAGLPGKPKQSRGARRRVNTQRHKK